MRRILSDSAWNMLGLVLPLLAAVVAIPVLIINLGADRFGVLSLIWVVIGYFALFDLGLGRAVTKLVSELDDHRNDAELQSLCLTSLCIAGVAGVLGCVIVLMVFWGCGITHHLPNDIQPEAHHALYWVAFCIPITVITAVLKGILEGIQRFRILNLIRGPMGAVFFFLPAAASYADSSLTMAVAMSVVARVVMLCAHYVPCRRMFVLRRQLVSSTWVRPLLEFGGWFTVSNLVGPIVVYMDRFVLAAIVPFSNIAYYTAPFELVSKVLNIPVALTSALFPVINKLRIKGDITALNMKARIQLLVFVAMGLILALGAGLSREFLQIWLGSDFAEHSTRIMQWLLVGFAFNALAQVTYVSLQSQSRTRVVAYLHLIELPLYGFMLWLLIDAFGMLGAAIAWAIRSLLDWLALEYLLRRKEISAL